MISEHVKKIREAHELITQFKFEGKKLHKGYADRYLRINLDNNEISIHPITEEMKKLWVGGKGFDLWLTFQEITKDTKWDSNENPICFSSGPLGGTTSFPGSGKTLVTAVSPITDNIIDCNVGGYFGPYLKFAGFDALLVTGKSNDEVIVLIDSVNNTISIERSPLEETNSHLIAEELTEMYADNEIDMRNIAVVSSGQAAEHSRMGVLNFSFWDWRRRVARLKQAGRGGIGTVFRNKKIKALVIKSQGITPAWRIEENKVAKLVTPTKIIRQECPRDVEAIENIIEKYKREPEFVMEMLLEIQEKFNFISFSAVEMISKLTGLTKAGIYHIITFYKSFSFEPKGENVIQVCTGSACQAKGAGILLEALQKKLGIAVGETTSDGKYTLEAASCLGACEIAPVIKFNNELIGRIQADKIEDLLSGNYTQSSEKKADTCKTIVLDKAYVLNKSERDYEFVRKLLTQKTNPGEIIDQIKKSGLKGRGGGGFAVFEKWKLCLEKSTDSKLIPYLVCNSSIIEPLPALVIEGLLIAAITLEAKTAHVCFRHEHSAEMERFNEEIEKARKAGLIGKNIMNSGIDFEIHLHRGAGGYVIGESSALLQTLIGKVSEPQPKYIHAAETGINKHPVLVHNIETWANIPLIFDKKGCCDSCNCLKNTKALLISGDIKRQGIIEIKLGTTLREIIMNGSEGLSKKKRTVKAVQIGGTGGGFIPGSLLDSPYDFESLEKEGCFIGSSAITVKDNRKCMVDSLRYSIEFLLEESCGKCTPCREGLFALNGIMKRIVEGNGKISDLDTMQDIAETMRETSLCQFGVTASAPVLTALKHFRSEFEEHILDKKCSCGTCKNLASFVINKDKCVGCTLCAQKCPVKAISGETKKVHMISQEKCIKCGICFDVCNFDAVEVK
ncbi:MAG: aldehyde ferredoxin oxidoreductase N-terminal domain-containing protein [Candidatus Cloacimonetes bacterium]|nr:aldehyde ferredoxin oxidoreductase N-terminal domain-containing protein [Candidatus Cloacimonadota bacterium]